MSNQKKIFLFLLILSTVAFVWLIRYFIVTITISILIVIFFNPLYKKLLFITKGKKDISAFLTIIGIFFAFLIPLAILVGIISWQVDLVANDFKNLNIDATNFAFFTDEFINRINSTLTQYSIDYQLTRDQIAIWATSIIQNVGLALLNWLRSFGSSIPDLITNLILLIILIHFFLTYQYSIWRVILKISPFNSDITKLYINKSFAMARSMIKGTFVIAFVQGTLSAIALWIADVHYVFFWFLILTIAAIIPFIGTGIILIPLSLVLLVLGNFFGAIIILIMQFLIISNIDNILRPKLVEQDVKLPESIILLGVVAGLYTFGPIGLIFGPVITVLVETTYEIYLKYYAYNIKSILTFDEITTNKHLKKLKNS